MVAGRISLLLVGLKWLVLVFNLPASELAFDGSVWVRQKSMGMLAWSYVVLSCRFLGFCRLCSVLNSGVPFIAMQAYWPCHLGIDNLNVARSIGRLLDRDSLVKPLPLVKDGDVIALAQYMIRTGGRETVRVTKVKGHAEDVDVQQGRVRLVDQQGNAEADTAADLGRRHQSEVLIGAGRRLLTARILLCWMCIGS